MVKTTNIKDEQMQWDNCSHKGPATILKDKTHKDSGEEVKMYIKLTDREEVREAQCI